MSADFGTLAAFAAGLVSFLSPCVLPLVPAYLSFLSGVSVVELGESEDGGAKMLLPALLFVAGFTLVFVTLGASASILGALLQPYRGILARLAGVLIIAMGVMLLGIVRVPWLYGEARADLGRSRAFGRGAGFVMGMAFAFGWTPCVGPILASILALAGSSADVGRGAALLFAYAAGLGVPFIAVALLFARARSALAWLNDHGAIIGKVAGTLLIVMGLLVVTDTLPVVTAWLLRLLPGLKFG